MDSIEEEPFLIKTSNQLDQESLRDLSSQKFQSRRRLTTQFLIHLGIFILYCTATYAITSRQSQPRYDEGRFEIRVYLTASRQALIPYSIYRPVSQAEVEAVR